MLQYQPDDSFVQARGAPCESAVAARRSRRAREDYRLFERYHRTGDRDDRDELVARLLPLARSLAWRYRDRAEYMEKGQPPAEWAGGHFNGRAVVTYDQRGGAGGSLRGLLQTLYHEASHQFVSLT